MDENTTLGVNRCRFHVSHVFKAKASKEILEAELQNYQQRLDDIDAERKAIKIKDVNMVLTDTDPFFPGATCSSCFQAEKDKKASSKAKLAALDVFNHAAEAYSTGNW